MFISKTLVAAILLVGMGSTFSVAQEKDKSKPTVAPMSQTDAKLTKCPVHGTKLKIEDVRISYGRPFVLEGYFEAQQHDFPHSNLRVLGGCVLSPDSPRKQTVKFCPQCREAEHHWLDAHKLPTSK